MFREFEDVGGPESRARLSEDHHDGNNQPNPTCYVTHGENSPHTVSNTCMSSSFSESGLRGLCWLVVVLELLLSFFILVLLATIQVYAHVTIAVAISLILGLAPAVMACLAIHNPKRASRVALWLTLPFAALAMASLPLHFPLSVVVGLVCTLPPDLFWTVASRRDWPLPLPTELFHRRPFLALSAVITLVCFLLVASIAVSFLLPWWPPVGDCSGGPLLDNNGKPRFIDFTARIEFVGPESFHGYALFSVARVEERFSDAIWSIPKIVILRDFFRPTDVGQPFFIEGKRSYSPFARFLPVVERVECGHSSRIGRALVQLRTLRGGPPQSGVRIIGAVFRSREDAKPSPGTTVLVKGPAENTVAVTDDDGVYDVAGLPFGQYTVELSTKDWHPVCALIWKRGQWTAAACSSMKQSAEEIRKTELPL
jgi:hypothetical protein